MSKINTEELEKEILITLMSGSYQSRENKSPAFQLYIQDFLVGTINMSTSEIGSYLLLLMSQWDKFGLDNNPEDLSEIARCEIDSLTKILKKFEKCPDGKLRNKKLEKVRAKQIVYSKGKSIIGKLGADKRYGKEPVNEIKVIPSLKSEVPALKESTIETVAGDFFYIGLERFNFPVSKYIKVEMGIFLESWQIKNPSIKIDNVLHLMDKEKVGHQYTDHRHIQNAFNLTAKSMNTNVNRSASSQNTNQPTTMTFTPKSHVKKG